MYTTFRLIFVSYIKAATAKVFSLIPFWIPENLLKPSTDETMQVHCSRNDFDGERIIPKSMVYKLYTFLIKNTNKYIYHGK